MSDQPPRPAFAVVGDAGVMSEDELARLLDLLVNRHLGERRICLLSPGNSPAHGWASSRGFTTLLVPAGAGRVKRDCELVVYADAVVVLGGPRPWRRLLALCREAGIPTRVFTGRPRLHRPQSPDPLDW